MRIFIFFSLFINHVFAGETCQLVSYEKIYKINNVLDQLIIKSSDCPEETKQKFIEIISNADGKINSTFISKYLNNSITTVEVQPKRLLVQSINKLLKEKLNLSNLHIVKTNSLLGKSALTTNSSDLISASCSSCNDIGNKNIKLKINSKQIWLNSTLGKVVSVYKSIQNINRQTPLLDEKDFLQTSITMTTKSNFFTDIENIRFYRLNRNIPKDGFLKNTDLTAKTLISYGQKVNLKIKTKNIQLKATGKAKRSGRLGDFIEVQNPKTQKSFIGKVVDYNKVLVEL